MAFAENPDAAQSIDSGANNGVGSDTTAFPNNVTSGDLLIVAGAAWGSTAAPTSVAVDDSQGSYTVDLGAVPVGLVWRTFIAYRVATATGANTVTVNPAGADSVHSFSYTIAEFSGNHATPDDVDGGDTTAESTTAADTITTGVNDALVIGVMSQESGTMALTPTGAGNVELDETESNSSNQCHAAAYRLGGTAGSNTVSWTTASLTTWSAQTHSFKPSAGGGGRTTKNTRAFPLGVNVGMGFSIGGGV